MILKITLLLFYILSIDKVFLSSKPLPEGKYFGTKDVSVSQVLLHWLHIEQQCILYIQAIFRWL